MATATINRQRYDTDEPDLGAAFIRTMYVDATVAISGDPADFVFAADLLQFNGTSISQLEHSMTATMTAAHGTDTTFFFQSHHSMNVDVGPDNTRLRPAEAMAFPPGHPYAVRWPAMGGRLVTLNPDVLADHVSILGIDPRTFAFDFEPALGAAASAHWDAISRHVETVARAASGHASALLTHELARLLAGAALVCFARTAAEPSEQPDNASSATLRRAVAFIDAHLDQPFNLTDLAAAARVSPRALQRLFQRLQGRSPMAYAREARLHAAHQELQQASPRDGSTVTAIAARWGFHSLPRFGVLYRTSYGQPPSQTLRND